MARRRIGLAILGLATAVPALAVPVPATATTRLLEVLRDSGVVVLLLESPSPDDVAALRARIAELPVRPRRHDDDGPVVTGVRPEGGDDDFDDD